MALDVTYNTNLGRLNLQWIPFICVLCLTVRQCSVKSELIREPPGCNFPDFLHSSDGDTGVWTWKYDGDIHVGKVLGGIYTICSNQYPRHSGDAEETCLESQMRRKCFQQYGPDLFAVQYEENRPTYQCIKFIQRGPAVVQLAVSDRHIKSQDICNQNMTLDHSPWISVKRYKTAVANCPFTGGYNFKHIWEYTRDHVGKQLCRYEALSEKQAPVRVESDCIEKEGFNMHFRERSCIPDKTFFEKSQKLVCMASWQIDGDGFALLRKENDRSFFCVRIVFNNLEVTTIVIYLDWECYRRSDLTGAGGKLSYSTPYLIFQNAEKRIISIPCSDELLTCSVNNDGDCLVKQCMQTCQQCLNSTGFPCEFDKNIIGNWDIRNSDNTRTKLLIHKNTLHHSNLGTLRCVTFDPDLRLSLREILWGTYQNGCYPRFLCMYYDTPTKSVLRYRLSNILQWPLELSDQTICRRENFQQSPDFNDLNKVGYEEKPWNIALERSKNIHRMPCFYPMVPDSASFVDNNNNYGCVIFRSRPSPKTVSLMYVSKSINTQSREHVYLYSHHGHQQFNCVAAITYINSPKIVMTITQGNEDEALCWMIVDSQTVIVVNTSSCNNETATGILNRDGKYMQHLKFLLKLDTAGEEVAAFCRKNSENNEKKWSAQLKQSIENQEPKVKRSSGSSSGKCTYIYMCVAFLWMLFCINILYH